MSNSETVLLSRILLSPISGSRPSGGVSADIEGIPSIGGENIVVSGGMNYDELKRIPPSFFKLMPKGKLQCNDVLINKDGAQTGKAGFYDGVFEEAAINEHVFILRGHDPSELEQSYLYYCVLLPETRNKIERRITGSAQPGLNSQFVKAVDIPLRPIPMQRKIARILQTIDQTIEKTEALIEKYQHIKAGLMHDLFTRGIGADGKPRPPREQAPELYQQTSIGWIPMEW
jgi:type I restriction enzyme, S subunit